MARLRRRRWGAATRRIGPGPRSGEGDVEELTVVAHHGCTPAPAGAVLVPRGRGEEARVNITVLFVGDGRLRELPVVVLATFSLCLGGVEWHQRVVGGETVVVGERIAPVVPAVGIRKPTGRPRGLLLLLEIREHLRIPGLERGGRIGSRHLSKPIIYRIGGVVY